MDLKSSLLAMKKNPAAALAKMKEEATKQTTSGKKDSRFWEPSFDKEKGSGSAVIRFLPSPVAEALPWVQVYSRKFKGKNGSWYFENDLSTLGRNDDPVYTLVKRLYDSGIKSDENVAKAMHRKVNYIANILVVNDPKKPDCNGKVFLYEFGTQIFKIHQDARAPKFEEDVELEPFNPWTGGNFNIRIVGNEMEGRTVPNYEKSHFAAPSALADTDEEIFEIISKGYALDEFIAPDKFKTLEELQTELFRVLGPHCGSGVETIVGWGDKPYTPPAEKKDKKNGGKPDTSKPAAQESETFDEGDALDEVMQAAPAKTTRPAQTKTAVPEAEPEVVDDDVELPPDGGTVDEDLEFMNNLMNG